MYEIFGDVDEIRELTKGVKLAEPALKRATVSSLNKTATSTRSYAARLISGDYKVTQAAVRKQLNISKANFSRMEARIYGEGSPGIPLYQFAPTPKRVPSTRRLKKGGYTPKGGIKVMVTRGKRKLVKGAFISKMKSGHVGVFRREEGQSKLPIKELYGPSPLRLIDQDRYQTKIDDYAAETLEKNMEHEADYYLKKFKVIPND